MGPTGTPTETPAGESVALAGGGLGNAVLFSIGRALREHGSRVLYFAAYRRREDILQDRRNRGCGRPIIWSVDGVRCPRRGVRRPRVPGQRRAGYGGPTRVGELGEVELRCPRASASSPSVAIARWRGPTGRNGKLSAFFRKDHVAIARSLADAVNDERDLRAMPQRHIDPVTARRRSFLLQQPGSAAGRRRLEEPRRPLRHTRCRRSADAWVRRLLTPTRDSARPRYYRRHEAVAAGADSRAGEALVRLYYPERAVEGLDRIPGGGNRGFVLPTRTGCSMPRCGEWCWIGRRGSSQGDAVQQPLAGRRWRVWQHPDPPGEGSGARGGDASRNDDSFAPVARAGGGARWRCSPRVFSHSDSQMRPLKTGAARIALSAEAENDGRLGSRRSGWLYYGVGLGSDHRSCWLWASQSTSRRCCPLP